MGLWVESAHETLRADEGTSADAVSTLTTEAQFVAAVIGGQDDQAQPRCRSGGGGQLVQCATANLVSGVALDAVVDDVLAALPAGEHSPVALLRLCSGGQAALAEIDAPPLFMARRGDLVMLPVTEEERAGRLVRRCDFTVQDGDHLAMVSEGYIRPRGGVRPWSWRDIALSIRRLTATGCDAEQLAGALVRCYERFAGGRSAYPAPAVEPKAPCGLGRCSVTILAMLVRPMRTATVWSGPPADPRRDREVLAKLMAEEGTRVICGDTTAEIAARLLGARLEMEPPPEEGWAEVPPVSRMVMPEGTDGSEPVALVTEGVVTMGVARQRLVEARRPRDLAGREDGASRLARMLLEADKVCLLVGAAVNPAQTERDGTPLRKAAVERLTEELKARGKIVQVEHV